MAEIKEKIGVFQIPWGHQNNSTFVLDKDISFSFSYSEYKDIVSEIENGKDRVFLPGTFHYTDKEVPGILNIFWDGENWLGTILKGDEKMKEVNFKIDSILPVIELYRFSANRTSHEYSSCIASEPKPCSDVDVLNFMDNLKRGENVAELVVSDIEWIKSGGCAGDMLYPVIMTATKLPDGGNRYYIVIRGRDIFKEYVLSWH